MRINKRVKQFEKEHQNVYVGFIFVRLEKRGNLVTEFATSDSSVVHNPKRFLPGGAVVCTIYDDWNDVQASGIARCMETDEFSSSIGKNIAFRDAVKEYEKELEKLQ